VSPHIDSALARLPQWSRQLLVEHFLEGVSQRELARQWPVSPATLSRRMKQALVSLRVEVQRKGMTLSVAPLLAMIGQAPVEAAPLTLAQELGKMAMFSGPDAGVAGGATLGMGLKLGIAATGTVVVGLALVAFMGIGNSVAQYTPAPSEHQAAVAAAVATTFESQGQMAASNAPQSLTMFAPPGQTLFVNVAGSSSAMASDRIVMFQQPHNRYDAISVVYGDGHMVSMPLDQARRLIEAQTGQRLEDVVDRYPKIDPSANGQP
jgi:hypothetical protein